MRFFSFETPRVLYFRGTVLTIAVSVVFLSLLPGPAKSQEGLKNNPVTITSNSMEVEGGGKVILFKGDVVAKDDFILCSDRLEVFYGEGDEVREIVASGNVALKMDDKTASGDKAVYDRIKRFVVLTGDARVGQCSDSVRGDRITVFLDEERSLVEGVRGGRVRAVIMPQKGICQESVKSEEDFCRGPR